MKGTSKIEFDVVLDDQSSKSIGGKFSSTVLFQGIIHRFVRLKLYQVRITSYNSGLKSSSILNIPRYISQNCIPV